MAREKRDAEESRRIILEEAERIFAEKGYEGARVDEIAKAAGVNKALIYYYFNSKKELLHELISSRLSEIITLKDYMIASDQELNEEDIKKIIPVFYTNMKKKKNLFKILMFELLKSNEGSINFFELIDISIEDIKKKMGETASHDYVDFMIRLFFFDVFPSAIFIVLQEKWSNHYGFDEEEVFDKFCDIVIQNTQKIMFQGVNELNK